MSVPYLFRSSWIGAPTLSGTAGQGIIPILKACLVDGFNIKTLDSLSQTDGLATATVTAGHGFNRDSPDTVRVRIAGAGDAKYNGDFLIRVTGAGTFTYPVDPAAPAIATGAITVKVAPLDWEIAFDPGDGLRCVFRSKDPLSKKFFLRILDKHDNPSQDGNYRNSYKTATAWMYENMTDVDNGTGSAKVYWNRAQSLNATPHPWILIGDGRRFWLITQWSDSFGGSWCPHFFGDVYSFKPGDRFNVILAGLRACSWVDWDGPENGYSTGSMATVWTGVGDSGMYIARPHFGLGGAVNIHMIGPYGGWMGRHASTTFPNPCDGGMFVSPPLMIQESGAFPTFRGIMPGILCPLNLWPLDANKQYLEYFDGFMVCGTPRKLLCHRGIYRDGGDRVAWDLTGPWE